jgi:polysaccharide export outer membrane protein
MTSECRIARGRQGWRAVVLAALICSTTLSGCAMKSGAGPSTGAVVKADGETLSSADIKIIDVTDDVARRVYASGQASSFAESLGDGAPVGSIVGKGDVLDISIWEAPPAALFGSAGGASILSSSDSTARGTSLPDQMVDSDGRIVIPFIGQVQAAGRTPQQIGREIVSRLNGMAHQPQVIVRVARNATTNVTIVGDVANSTRVPLTARGERVLDVLASAGGVKQPVGKTVIQITRGAEVASLPLEAIIKDPRQNIRLQTR